jgi:DNA repair exonuclease SbcCD ATPase subunit
MQLLKLSLSNFKRFSDPKFSFGSGLNLIWGPNESGKSTVHEAISCALFGRERGKTIESWAGGNCTLTLDYIVDGESFRIVRAITEGTCALGRIVDGELTDAISSKDEVSALIAKHLGISSRTTFENTVSIKQMCVSTPGVTQMEEVGSDIQRVLTGTAHISASEVQKRLESRRDSIKGRPRPANPRDYERITVRLRELAESLADARGSRERIKNLDEEHSQLEERIERDSARFHTLEGLLDRHKRWSELRKRQADAEKRHEEIFATTRKVTDTLSDLKTLQEELEDYADLVGKDSELAEQLSKISARSEELQARVDELSAVAEENKTASRISPRVLFLAGAAITAVLGLIARLWIDPRGIWLFVPSGIFLILYVGTHATGSATESKQIAELLSSADRELRQLEAEEQNILSYVSCRTSDQAWARIKAYRNLATRAHELELTLNAVLGGRGLKDLEQQESSEAREVSTLRAEMKNDFDGYAPTTEETESWRAEYAAIQSSLPRAKSRLHEVLGSLESEQRDHRDLAALEGEMEFLHQRRNELDFTFKAYEEAISAINTVTKLVSEEYIPTLCEEAADILGWVTGGRYASISIKPGWEISVDAKEKTGVQPAALSGGTHDQLYLALRMACGQLLSSGRKLPLIFDDPFASFDRTRLDSILSLIAALSRENQFIILTHDPYILDWARNVARTNESPCTIHELHPPETTEPI